MELKILFFSEVNGRLIYVTLISDVILGIIAKTRKAFSVSIIGGADGPTSVFVAGKVGSDISAGLVIAGVVLITVVVAFGLRKLRK